MKIRNSFARAAVAFLEQHGIDNWRYDLRSRHPRLIFQHNGREIFIIVPRGNSNNPKAKHYAARNLRHALGLGSGRPA